MTFSYSRLTAFDSCKYKWLMKYILGVEKPENSFFSTYGSFIHDLLAKYYRGEGDSETLALEYLEQYFHRVLGKPMHNSTAINYFNQGLDMISSLKPVTERILGVEQEVRWKLGGRDYIGYVDLILQGDNGIIIRDHKSRDLKPRSNRKKPTKGDKELDEYLRQLYMYSKPIKEIYGEYPVSLEFNCYRTQTLIEEPFDEQKYAETCDWAIKKADSIEKNEDWRPNIEFFGCKYLCDVNRECEYYNAGR